MTKEFDLLIFVGRFQPFHNEHKRIIDIAHEKAEHVLVLVGSSGKARTIRNPWTFEERRRMILGSYETVDYTDAEELLEWLNVRPLYDKLYNDPAWIKQVQEKIHSYALHIANKGTGSFHPNGIADLKIGLIGASKDNTSYYLKLFPQFESVNVAIKNPIHATSIREDFLLGKVAKHELAGNIIPKYVADFIYEAFDLKLREELNFVKEYKKQWTVAPYPVKHATVDAVVEQSGHILLVKRRAAPGKGLWALPGGHVEEYERQIDAVMRELREETKIKVPEAVLRGSIVAEKTFDDPHRSTIGRVITQAYHIKLKDDTKLPKIKGSDDAEKAIWLPIGELKEDMMFDDHFHIISYFLGI